MIIHELGHGFFIRIFGGKIDLIGFGSGPVLIKFKKFVIGKKLILTGRIEWNIEKTLSVHQRFLISFGGIFFNIVTATIVWIFVDVRFADFYRGFIIYSYLIAIASLIPLTYSDGVKSDGLKLFELIKGKSSMRN